MFVLEKKLRSIGTTDWKNTPAPQSVRSSCVNGTDVKKDLFKTPRLQKKGNNAVDAEELREVGLEQIRETWKAIRERTTGGGTRTDQGRHERRSGRELREVGLEQIRETWEAVRERTTWGGTRTDQGRHQGKANRSGERTTWGGTRTDQGETWLEGGQGENYVRWD